MRTYVRPSLFALAALAASAALAGAQSLGELAAKEKERQEKERQKRGGASKVITENDLGGRKGGTLSNAGATAGESAPAASPSPAAAGGAGVKPAEAKEKTPDEIRAEQENDWRQRTSRARDEVTQLTDKVNRIQQTLNDLTANLYSSSRTAVIQQFDATKAELAAAQQKVADLEEEGRRNQYR
jgi:hypothetical protein